MFRARTRGGQERTYEEFLKRTTVPFVRRQPGCREVRIGRTYTTTGDVEFIVLTVWDSVEHLKDATGARWDQPVIDPEEAPLLDETEVEHFEEF
jgi:heme-degrading monooxygenase HmoA